MNTRSSSRKVTEPSGKSSGFPALNRRLGSYNTFGTRKRTAAPEEAAAARAATLQPIASWTKLRRDVESLGGCWGVMTQEDTISILSIVIEWVGHLTAHNPQRM